MLLYVSVNILHNRDTMEQHRVELLGKLKAAGAVTAADAVVALKRTKEHTRRFIALQLCILREVVKLKVWLVDTSVTNAAIPTVVAVPCEALLFTCTEVPLTGRPAQRHHRCDWVVQGRRNGCRPSDQSASITKYETRCVSASCGDSGVTIVIICGLLHERMYR